MGQDSGGRERRQTKQHTCRRAKGEQRRRNLEPPIVLLWHEASHFPFMALGVRGWEGGEWKRGRGKGRREEHSSKKSTEGFRLNEFNNLYDS